MGKIAVILFAAIMVIASQVAIAGTTWYVDDNVSPPGDGTSWETAFKTIQEGIDAASEGDTVIVAQGTYVENIHFHGKNITLTSTDPLDPAVVEGTVIDGNQSGPVVTFSGTENESCVLSGFTIRNGQASGGAGIRGTGRDSRSRARIENNVVTANSAGPLTGSGGGIGGCDGLIRDNVICGNSATRRGAGLYSCHGIIQNNVITDNSADNNGGGLARCDGTIRDNLITNNQSAGFGGGLFRCNGTIENNTISGNRAEDEASHSDGGGLSECNGTIRNNIITANWAAYAGGGLAYCDATITHNTISENAAPKGGGLYKCDGTIEYNDISGNTAEDWGGGLYGCDGTIQNNTISANSAAKYNSSGGGLSLCSGHIQSNTISGNSARGWGGGLCGCHGPVENNIIIGNSANQDGGGLYGCNGTIRNNVITENEAIGTEEGGYGGGLAHCDGLIADNSISGNKSHGAEQWLSEGGGGLTHCNGTIENNVITDNSAVRAGGGLSQCHGIIQGNTISGNSGDRGGGLGYCDAIVQNNTISGNSAADYNSSGGGLAWCSGPILNNTISGNVADGWGGGLHYCDGPIENNVIAGNVVKYDGGGLYGCNNTIQNNVISCNSAHFHGGGLAYCDGTLLNNTICGNSAFIRGGGLHVCQGSIRNCIIWGNSQMRDPQLYDSATPSYCCIQDWIGDGQGNISDDPRFVDPDGADDNPQTYEDNDYRLAEGSPCIDAGWNQDPMWEATDLDGGPRILYGGSSFTVDIGAYEHRPMYLVQCHTDQANINYASGTFLLPLSITNFGSELPEPFSIWLVVRDIVFPSPGPNSTGALWNADGITSDLYLGVAAYYYVDISDLPPPDDGGPYQTVLEFYIKDRNPNFEPVIELWAFRPIPSPAQHTLGQGIAPHPDNSGNGRDSFGGNPPAVWRPHLQIKPLASLTGEAILLQWECGPGDAFVVQAAESPMGPWTEISDHIQPLGTLSQWADSPPVHVRRRFYRILQMPR